MLKQKPKRGVAKRETFAERAMLTGFAIGKYSPTDGEPSQLFAMGRPFRGGRVMGATERLRDPPAKPAAYKRKNPALLGGAELFTRNNSNLLPN